MSTATVAGARGVRPLAAIKADYANALANTPASVMADLRAAVAWLPKKVWKGIVRFAQFLHVPQMAAFVGRNFRRFLRLVGPKAFAVEVATSRWGQATVRTTVNTAARMAKWAIKTTWRIVTSPLRLFAGGRKMLDKVDTKASKVNAKLTPGSGTCWPPLQAARDGLAWFFSWQRTGIKLVRTAAGASMALSVTRKVIPPGPFRWLSYAVDAVLVGITLRNDLKGTWFDRSSREVWSTATDKAKKTKAKTEERTLVHGVAAEADRITRQAAEADAIALREQAKQTELEGRRQANLAREQIVKETTAAAEELRKQADVMEAQAVQAAADEEAAKIEAASAVAVMDPPETVTPEPAPPTPAPGPVVPPSMGGRTPSKQPSPPKPPQGNKPAGGSPQGGGGSRN